MSSVVQKAVRIPIEVGDILLITESKPWCSDLCKGDVVKVVDINNTIAYVKITDTDSIAWSLRSDNDEGSYRMVNDLCKVEKALRGVL